MTIFPAIDIRGGRCVRLSQGRAEAETVYYEDPLDIARVFKDAGSVWAHVVDLDGAFTGEQRNLPVVAKIAALGLKVQLGGGLRSRDAIARALDAGVARVVVGTRAAESAGFVAEIAAAFPGQVAVGIDAKDGRVAVRGWVDETPLGALELARRVADAGVGAIIHTDIGTDGMLTGPNLAAQEALCRAAPAVDVIASGGVSEIGDVAALKALSLKLPNLAGVIIGKAIYEKRLTAAEALAVAAA